MKTFTIAAITALIVSIGAVYFTHTVKPLGNSVTQGIVPKVATDATTPVGPQLALSIASANSGCTARIVSTASTSVMLSFLSTLTPSATVGHYQAASTTAIYENAVYGCGAITAYGSASSTITVVTVSQ